MKELDDNLKRMDEIILDLEQNPFLSDSERDLLSIVKKERDRHVKYSALLRSNEGNR